MRTDEEMSDRKAARRASVVTALLALAALAFPVHAQTQTDPGEVHGLRLGLHADAMSTDDWGELACGSNGGPPRQTLDTWSEFKKCPPEASGLHEVYARFDDEAEYIGKAIDDPLFAGEQTGTRVAGHPVILSALFDDAGVLRGIRMVSDPRATPLERRMAHLLKVAVMNHYGPEGWTCVDTPPDPGETPVGGVFIKQRCQKTTPERAMTVEAHFLRKPGQNAVDPETHDYTQGQFESWTRFELFDPSYKKP
jgi:hypothetical protein